MGVNFASTDFAQFPSAAAMDVDGAISFFMRTTQVTSPVEIAGRHVAASSAQGFGLIMNSPANKASFYGKNLGSQTRFNITSLTSVNDGNWHHIVGNWNRGSGTTQQLAVDGVIEASAAASGAWAFTTGVFREGKSNDTFWAGYVGDLAELAYYNANLTQAEITALSQGFRPSIVCPAKLVLYTPDLGIVQDVKGAAASITGTSPANSSPRLF